MNDPSVQNLFIRDPDLCAAQKVIVYDTSDCDTIVLESDGTPRQSQNKVQSLHPKKMGDWDKSLAALVRAAPRKWFKANPKGLALRMSNLLWAYDVVLDTAVGPSAVAGSEEGISLLSQDEDYGKRIVIRSWDGPTVLAFGDPEFFGVMCRDSMDVGFAFVHGRGACHGFVLDQSYVHREREQFRECDRFRSGWDPSQFSEAVRSHRSVVRASVQRELEMWDECERPSWSTSTG
jgi:hypothetical protein